MTTPEQVILAQIRGVFDDALNVAFTNLDRIAQRNSLDDEQMHDLVAKTLDYNDYIVDAYEEWLAEA